jgi:hypothetical protein
VAASRAAQWRGTDPPPASSNAASSESLRLRLTEATVTTQGPLSSRSTSSG